jgi:hypothetical protein
MVLIGSFNSLSPFIGLVLSLILFSYSVSIMVDAGKTKPPTQKDTGDFMFGFAFLIASLIILNAVKDSWLKA